MHAFCPVFGWNEPFGHGLHGHLPVTELKDPLRHGSCADAVRENRKTQMWRRERREKDIRRAGHMVMKLVEKYARDEEIREVGLWCERK